MKSARLLALAASVGLAVSFAGVGAAVAGASTTPRPQTIPLRGSSVPTAERAHPAGTVAAKTRVRFDLLLTLRNASGARAFVRAVSTPGSREFHRYLTDARWVSRFGPTKAEVARAKSWLRRNHFAVGSAPKDRLFIPATGTAFRIERTFGVTLGYYRVNGHTVQLANGPLTIPASMASTIAGVVGVNEYLATTGIVGAAAKTVKVVKPDQEPAPPAGFRNPQPCSRYWGQKIDTADSPSLYAPYTAPLPYDICGYKPAQLRGAYRVESWVNRGIDGTGSTLAIVDAYDSPTLLSDAQLYFRLNDPTHPLSSSQFTNFTPPIVDDEGECSGSGWFSEAALDVESSHSMAPGAHINFVGAQDCFDTSLLAAEQTAITSGASVVSNSWGDTLGDLFTDAATKAAFDNTFLVAAATGVSILFSSGDFGDNFAISGIAAPDYPASSPFVTAVGGTSLEIDARNNRQAEYGWSTAKQVLCEPPTTTNCGTATTPLGKLALQAAGGGGTSYTYTQPYYQAPVVPLALALRNAPIFGPVPLRVIPDISMDADASTGMLIGLTQTFPDGVYYDQFKEGGTSLASPLLAGVIADVNQAAVIPLGFLNPALYKAYLSSPTAFNDVVAPADPLAAALIRVDYVNSVDPTNGYVVSLRVINYEGPETYCDGTGNCATRDVTLTTTSGFDSMTGLGSVGPRFINELSKF
ncbi:MAG: protease pro-enzyme activation domain-containing protein [Streptosporangiaceae bacterium]